MEINKIYQGDSLESLKTFPDKSINCCVTSPPYYGLRDYGTGEWIGGDNNCSHTSNNSRNGESAKVGNTRSGEQGGASHINLDNVCVMCGATKVDLQLGLEQTLELYVERLVTLFREVKRVLRDDGTLWLNLGDSYAGSGNGSNDKNYENRYNGKGHENNKPIKVTTGLKPKDLIGIPWMVAFALRADGWYLRQDIIWHKPNPMPESVTDRCTKSHEYIFLLSKSRKYYYDYEAIKQPVADETILRMNQQIEQQSGSDRVPGKSNGNMKAVGPGRMPRKGIDCNGGNQGSEKGIPAMAINGNGVKGHSGYFDQQGNLIGGGMANKKSVWTVTTKPFKEAHFATFPPDLIVDCIKAGCPENGIVLDPFMGSGTTAMVARKLNRNYIGFELNPDYIKISNKRLYQELGLYL